jgi:magnesium transporter
LRRDLILFRKSVWSLRDAINTLIRDDSPLISEQVKIYLRDVYDHVVQVIDSIETSREMVYSLYDMYMSGLSNRMNEVMKVLTVIATIFIPLTFIAGIYGMNFDPGASPWNMPELGWYYGYPLVTRFDGTLITSIMLYYFRKREWF